MFSKLVEKVTLDFSVIHCSREHSQLLNNFRACWFCVRIEYVVFNRFWRGKRFQHFHRMMCASELISCMNATNWTSMTFWGFFSLFQIMIQNLSIIQKECMWIFRTPQFPYVLSGFWVLFSSSNRKFRSLFISKHPFESDFASTNEIQVYEIWGSWFRKFSFFCVCVCSLLSDSVYFHCIIWVWVWIQTEQRVGCVVVESWTFNFSLRYANTECEISHRMWKMSFQTVCILSYDNHFGKYSCSFSLVCAVTL